jgi:hypothetical protein
MVRAVDCHLACLSKVSLEPVFPSHLKMIKKREVRMLGNQSEMKTKTGATPNHSRGFCSHASDDTPHPCPKGFSIRAVTHNRNEHGFCAMHLKKKKSPEQMLRLRAGWKVAKIPNQGTNGGAEAKQCAKIPFLAMHTISVSPPENGSCNALKVVPSQNHFRAPFLVDGAGKVLIKKQQKACHLL